MVLNQRQFLWPPAYNVASFTSSTIWAALKSQQVEGKPPKTHFGFLSPIAVEQILKLFFGGRWGVFNVASVCLLFFVSRELLASNKSSSLGTCHPTRAHMLSRCLLLGQLHPPQESCRTPWGLEICLL